MAFLKFNKHELVNLSYSLKREILCANKTGAYCNTSIVTCNTRRYHGLLGVPVDNFGGHKYVLLSCVDESLITQGKQFNLGIHCYDDIYEPKGHKYIVDFGADPVPEIVYKVGSIVFSKSILLVPDRDQVMIRYELREAPGPVELQLKPFLSFRRMHALTHQNDQADTSFQEVRGGVSFCMYEGFPRLNLQMNSSKASFKSNPFWYNGITYSDEYRRGFDCKEDLFVPGFFSVQMKPGDSVILSASVSEVAPRTMKKVFEDGVAKAGEITSFHDQLVHQADLLKRDRGGRKQITAGYSWLYTGLLRETLLTLPGLTLYATGDMEEFEAILDNLIADEQERLFRKTTQVAAPLTLPCALQSYIEFGADARKVWKKYGQTVKGIIESYAPGCREEVSLHPNGLLWAQKDRTALTWMNAYIDGYPVTERAGYQVETNAFWYNALSFAIDMERRFVSPRSKFISKWTPVRDTCAENYQKTFLIESRGYLADYVDNNGQNADVRPNQLYALWVPYSPVDDEVAASVLHVIDGELVTKRGIRTLSPRDVKYKGVYEGTQTERDLAYQQGCAWPFLLEPYIAVAFRIKGVSFYKRAEWLCEGFFKEDLGKHGVGAFSELYDGDPPHEPHGAISSALSTAALLGIDYIMDQYKEDK